MSSAAVATNALLGLIALLWSLNIGEEDVETSQPNPPSFNHVSPQTTKQLSGPGSNQPNMDPEYQATIDRQAFLASFRRQARSKLLPCLQSWQASPASVVLSATLSKNGAISETKTFEQELPSCVEEAMAEMNFSNVSAALSIKAVVVQWRVDW